MLIGNGDVGPGGPPSTLLTTDPAGRLKTVLVSIAGSAAVPVLQEPSSEVHAGLEET